MRQLPNDICRCTGEGCEAKNQCLRYRQIELDQKAAEAGFTGWVSVTRTLREQGEICDSFIKFEE